MAYRWFVSEQVLPPPASSTLFSSISFTLYFFSACFLLLLVRFLDTAIPSTALHTTSLLQWRPTLHGTVVMSLVQIESSISISGEQRCVLQSVAIVIGRVDSYVQAPYDALCPPLVFSGATNLIFSHVAPNWECTALVHRLVRLVRYGIRIMC